MSSHIGIAANILDSNHQLSFASCSRVNLADYAASIKVPGPFTIFVLPFRGFEQVHHDPLCFSLVSTPFSLHQYHPLLLTLQKIEGFQSSLRSISHNIWLDLSFQR